MDKEILRIEVENKEQADIQRQKKEVRDINQGSHFGPWMLVKRNPRRKNSNDTCRIINNQFGEKRQIADRRAIP